MPQIIGDQVITPLITDTPQVRVVKSANKPDDSLSKTQWEVIIAVVLFIILILVIIFVLPKVKVIKI